jgi:hypothetical protein
MNRTFNLLIQSRRLKAGVFALRIQQLIDNQARTEAISSGIEKKRFSAYGIGWRGTLTAHLVGGTHSDLDN